MTLIQNILRKVPPISLQSEDQSGDQVAKNKLKALEVKKGLGKLFDGGGLYLFKRNLESGRWSYRYKIEGRAREMGLGPFPTVSLASARADRDKWETILKSGIDPISARDRNKAEARAEESRVDPTFSEAADITFEAVKRSLRGEGKNGRWLSPLHIHIMPHIGDLRMSKIHQSDIHKALIPIWHTKHPTAEKAIHRTRKIFAHMHLSGVECSPLTVDMAAQMLGEVNYTAIPTPASDWRDIQRIWNVLSRHEASHHALRFMILTAVRSAGVQGAKFSEIEGDVWTVTAERMKGREGKVSAFRVPLSSAALEIVDHARKWRRSDYIFQGPLASGISDVAIGKVFKKVDPTGKPHGLRTTFRTWAQEVDHTSYDVAETALAHIVGYKVERSYARSDLLDQRRVLMQRWADYVTDTEMKVVKIRG
jgi:integrase